jgi:ATP-dependent Lhr-like helicase
MDTPPGADDVLELFSPATASWFRETFGAATPAQSGAWRAIADADDTLVIAPTGSGKTLAAFLWEIDRLAARDPSDPAPVASGTSVLYISPLKALGVDVQRNLTSPLVGARRAAERLGTTHRAPSVGIRTGDTPPAERRRLAAHPPDMLITTPESLFLMLSSQARSTLSTVRTVIIDEVHAVAGTKRGVHLALSLARLDALVERGQDERDRCPPQRIGLSATVEPADEVAAFLTGTGRPRPVQVVRPPATKTWDLSVTMPVPDLEVIDPPADATDEEDVSGTIWPHVQRAVLDEVLAHRSTIVFTNSRRQAERLTSALNLLHRRRVLAETAPDLDLVPDPNLPAAAQVDTAYSASDPTRGPDAPEVPDVARAHHGSMSKEHRAQIEEQLKAGLLRCVVATSSLELGIDMGAVDLVIQVESPFSVSSALQRFGRAGHDVGAISTAVVHPLHAADVVRAAVTVREARSGRIEATRTPRNALDVLAQQTVSAAIEGELDVEDWFARVRSCAPYASLPREAFDGVVDLLAGRYPSTAFAELRPRLVHDRERGVLTPRPGAQRLVTTSGGTIPDRGLYPVFLVASQDDGQARRVGELDEEMVYESRRGDIITLGTSSWKIEEITAQRVTVSPAFGLAGRIPFWHGEGDGRPAQLGRAIGDLQSRLATGDQTEARTLLRDEGLDENAAGVAVAHVRDQQQATGVLPSPTHLVVERFLDELGDWRVVLHCPLGRRLIAPWALAVGARVEERYGLDGQVMAADDGIVLRIPHGEEPPGADLFVFSPEQIDQDVRDRVGSSALFAARFRECAARALLLPRRDPGSRAPLWQQRQRAGHLLEVARPYPEFPIMLEAARECLQDVYDLPALVGLMRDIEGRQVHVTEVETAEPSPFARSLLLGYVAQFLYDADAPLAERRTAALALDQSLLGQLMGTVSLRELLDADVIADVEQQLQGLTEQRALRGPENLADALRRLGPLTEAQVAARMSRSDDDQVAAEGDVDADPASGPDDDRATGDDDDGATCRARELIDDLVASRRALRVRFGGAEHVAAVEDAGLLRDALGVALPVGLPQSLLDPVPDAVEQLVSRWARVRGPFTTQDLTAAFGLAPAVARGTLEHLTSDHVLDRGEFTPGHQDEEWVDAEVLRRLRRASLAASRKEIEPVPGPDYARFLGRWQHLVPRRADGTREHPELRGTDGLLTVIDQLAGVSLPLSAWESQVLPARLPGYTPSLLDELLASGEVVWSGHGRLGKADGWIRLHLAGALALGMDADAQEEAADALDPEGLPARILALLRSTPGALRQGEILTALADQDRPAMPQDVGEALWDLAFSSLLTGDSFQGLRTLTLGPVPHRTSRATGRSRPTSRRGAARLSAAMMRAGASSPSELQAGPALGGRWSALRVEPVDPSARAAALSTLLLDRHGVVTRGGMDVEDVPGSFAAVYRVLARLEENGHCRRGYFVDGLGASQFAPGIAVDLLRDRSRESEAAQGVGKAVVLAATDPANPYGAALPWPALPTDPPEGRTVRPARRAGALVVLIDGHVAAFVDKGAKSLLWWAGLEDATGAEDGRGQADGRNGRADDRPGGPGAGSDRPDRDHPAPDPLGQAAAHLVRAISEDSLLPQLAVERINGRPITDGQVASVADALVEAGCYRSPRAIRVRAGGR